MPETLILQGILTLIFYPTVEDGIIVQERIPCQFIDCIQLFLSEKTWKYNYKFKVNR